MQKKILSNLKDTITSAQSTSLKFGHRLPVFIHAPKEFIKDISLDIKHWHNNHIYISRETTLKANDIIGHEYDLIGFHLHDDFDPNLMAAIAGTLKSGGAFLLLCTQQPQQKNISHFHKYILENINTNEDFLKFNLINNILETNQPTKSNHPLETEIKNAFLQQKKTIELIKKVSTGHRKRPLTMTANRGRGKSAAIGIAIGELILEDRKQPLKIIITGPSLAATAIIFKHIISTTNTEGENRSGDISYNNNTVSFIAPDKLLNSLPKIDLLIVDEAAGINVFTLECLLKNYSRIVFSTTVHGYEGSGQGFITRFSKTLYSITPQWKATTLDQPIRWNSNDPLESFVDKIFMLSVKNSPNINIDINHIHNKIISKTELINITTNTLESIFTLLKAAHYKTSPNDLRQLMDSENAIIFASFHQDTLVAAAITEKEGKLTTNLIEDIYLGNRRPKGELMPQSIVMHLGLKEAGKMQHLRIMRIAVHPNLQGKKIGSQLIAEIIKYSKKNAVDFIGCSFGATTQLLRFWYALGFHTLRIGYKKNGFSGCNAALLSKPISNDAINLTMQANTIFIENFIAQLSESLKELDSEIAGEILKQHFSGRYDTEISKKIRDDIVSFAKHNRSYDDNFASINTFLLNSHTFNSLTKNQLTLIILKVLQRNSWEEVSKKCGFTGKKQALSEFKACLSKALEVHP